MGVARADARSCLNCGAEVRLAYCPECGQARTDPDPTLGEFVHEAAEELLHWDGKLGQTYRTLLARPGVLTREYIAGRRVRYISPLRVYLTCSVLFFFLAALVPERVGYDRQGRPVHTGIVQVGASSPADLAALDSLARRKPLVQRVWLQHLARGLAVPGKLTGAVLAAVPQTMFVLVPLFAALVGFATRDRRRRYPQHLAFALHEHAVLYLGLFVVMLARFTSSVVLTGAAELVIGVAVATHLVMAARVVYERSLASTLARLALATSLYLACFIAMLFVTFGIIVLEF